MPPLAAPPAASARILRGKPEMRFFWRIAVRSMSYAKPFTLSTRLFAPALRAAASLAALAGSKGFQWPLPSWSSSHSQTCTGSTVAVAAADEGDCAVSMAVSQSGSVEPPGATQNCMSFFPRLTTSNWSGASSDAPRKMPPTASGLYSIFTSVSWSSSMLFGLLPPRHSSLAVGQSGDAGCTKILRTFHFFLHSDFFFNSPS